MAEKFANLERRYFAVDGGGGAKLLSRLAATNDRLRRVSSPRHAEILLVFEPITARLIPSVLELYRAIPRPRGLIIAGDASAERFPDARMVRVEDLVPGAERVANPASADEIGRRMVNVHLTLDEAPSEPQSEAKTISLPGKGALELTTELVVLSLGPVQPFTAGPLRLLLVCDGEQIVSAQIEAGYAARDVAGAMTRATPSEIADLASALDPLAPVAGRIAYVSALERLHGHEPDALVIQQREAALALERAQNHLCWLVRFAEILANDRLIGLARSLYCDLTEMTETFWRQSPVEWLMPRASPISVGATEHISRVGRLVERIVGLRNQLAKDRGPALRTTGIGILSSHRLREHGVSGPNLRASEHGPGDILSRLLTRVDEAAADLRKAAEARPDRKNSKPGSAEMNSAVWSMPAGDVEVTVEGPRGQIGFSLTSDGETLRRISWRRPSAILLGLVPEILAGQKLADAELILASLDLAMAEADG
jgi:Ni,Fe-hydrogenase III large subunit